MQKEIKTIEGISLKTGKDFSPQYLSQLEDFFVNAPVGMMILNKDGRVLRMNGALLELLEIADEDLVKDRNYLDFFCEKRVQDYLKSLTDSELKVNNVVTSLNKIDGNSEQVYLDINVHWQNCEISHSRWFIRPVHSRVLPSFERDADTILELPQSEQNLRFELLNDFFENAPVGVHFVGLNGLILKSNIEEKRLLGYDKTPEQYDGIHVSKIHWDKKKIELLLTRLAESVPVIDEKAFMYGKDGTIAVMRIYSGLRLKGGKFENTRCFLFADPNQNQEPYEMQEYSFPNFEVKGDIMEPEKTTPKSLENTRETWSRAIKYVAERKQMEEALGFIIESNRVFREHTSIEEMLNVYMKMMVPYLADVVCFDFSPIGRDEKIRASTAHGIEIATVNRLRVIASSKISNSLTSEGELINDVMLLREKDNSQIKKKGAFMWIPIIHSARNYGSLLLIKCTDDIPKFSDAIHTIAKEISRHVGMSLNLSRVN